MIISAILSGEVTHAYWNRTPMKPIENDRWDGVCHFHRKRLLRVQQIWRGRITSNRGSSLFQKYAAGNTNLRTELDEASHPGPSMLLDRARAKQTRAGLALFFKAVEELRTFTRRRAQLAKNPERTDWPDGSLPDVDLTAPRAAKPIFALTVDRVGSALAAWYEVFFHRSAEGT